MLKKTCETLLFTLAKQRSPEDTSRAAHHRAVGPPGSPRSRGGAPPGLRSSRGLRRSASTPPRRSCHAAAALRPAGRSPSRASCPKRKAESRHVEGHDDATSMASIYVPIAYSLWSRRSFCAGFKALERQKPNDCWKSCSLDTPIGIARRCAKAHRGRLRCVRVPRPA